MVPSPRPGQLPSVTCVTLKEGAFLSNPLWGLVLWLGKARRSWIRNRLWSTWATASGGASGRGRPWKEQPPAAPWRVSTKRPGTWLC